MHIADGIIDTKICIAAHAVAMVAVYLSGRKAEADEIPKMGVTGAALFSVSLVHLPFAGTAVHPGLYGLAGIILGKRSFSVVYIVLLFQALLFQHGGLITLGVNALNMGLGAVSGWLLWRIGIIPLYVRAFLAGLAGIVIPALLMAAEFEMSGYGKGIRYILSASLLLALLEGSISMLIVKFFRKTKSDIIRT